MFEPGLLWGAALGLAVLGLVVAPPVWPVLVLCWLLLAAGAALMALRLRGLLQVLDVAPRSGLLVATAGVVAALLGVWLAGSLLGNIL